VATSRPLAPMYVSASSGMVQDCGKLWPIYIGTEFSDFFILLVQRCGHF
jgi:hypothetical protein